MALVLVRRILFAGTGTWLLVMAADQIRLGGHTAPAVGLGAAGILLAALAIAGKGG